MKRKAIAADMLGVMLILTVLVLIVIGGIMWRVLASQNASEVMYRYTLAIKDKEIQLLKDGFEKTAIFYSLEETARELGLHGGLSKKSLAASTDGKYITGVSPPLRFETRDGEKIPYWVVPSSYAGECGTARERIPYLRVTDLGRSIGLKTLGGGKAITEADLIWNVGGRYDPYFNEVNSGKYTLYVLLQVFFARPSVVTVECGNGCVEITELDGSAPKPITADGIYEYKITKVSNSVTLLNVNLTADEGSKGNGLYAARLKQVVVSIYDNSIDKSGNSLFLESANKFQASMSNALTEKNAMKSSDTTIGPLAGAFYRGEGATAAGIVWSPNNIISDTEDFLGNDRLLYLTSSGVTEEEAKIRYWVMYDYASSFARSAGDLLRYRLWKRLNDNFVDHIYYNNYKCGTEPVCSDNTYCADDDAPVNKYTEDYVYARLTEELAALSSEYNGLSVGGISWDVQIPRDMFKGCTANTNSDACGPAETCVSDNFEYYEYIRDEKALTGCCSTCDSSSSGCSSSSSGTGCSSRENRCTMHYDHRYILKNIRVLVTITDSKNKVFNAATRNWENLQFKFFIFLPVVDDNKCADHACSTQASPAPQYPSVSPSLSAVVSVAPPPAPPASPVSVSFVKPSGGSSVSGDILFEVSATSTAGNIALMEFYVVPDATSRAVLTSSPYTWTWKSGAKTPPPAGQQKVKAIVYDDKSNSGEAEVTVNFVDVAAPVISSISAKNITSSSADIVYDVGELVTSKLEYGETSLFYFYSKSNSVLHLADIVPLTGLMANTTYHYKLTVTDVSGNSASTVDATFKTLP